MGSPIASSRVLTVALGALLLSCAQGGGAPDQAAGRPSVSARPVELFDGRVISAMPELLGMRAQYELRLEWLELKHAILLEQMRARGIGMWIVISEEFHPDAVTQYVAPPLHYTRRRDVMVFVDAGEDGLASYSDYWRPTDDYRRFFEPLPSARNARGIQDTSTGLRALWERHDPADHRAEHRRGPGPRQRSHPRQLPVPRGCARGRGPNPGSSPPRDSSRTSSTRACPESWNTTGSSSWQPT